MYIQLVGISVNVCGVVGGLHRPVVLHMHIPMLGWFPLSGNLFFIRYWVWYLWLQLVRASLTGSL